MKVSPRYTILAVFPTLFIPGYSWAKRKVTHLVPYFPLTNVSFLVCCWLPLIKSRIEIFDLIIKEFQWLNIPGAEEDSEHSLRDH
jgi:hypothetical protein